MSVKKLIAALLVTVLCASQALTACSPEEGGGGSAQTQGGSSEDIYGPRNDADDTWAIYWYICGSNLETGFPRADGSGLDFSGAASRDIAELLSAKLPDNVTVVIETGGALEWQMPEIDASANCRFVYDSSGFRLIEKRPQALMCEQETLVSFLSFCNDNYPADHQVVVFWDHGCGSVRGFLFDEHTNNRRSMHLPELRAAFEAVSTPNQDSPQYELVVFDACLMATIDVAETLNGFTHWMVASEEFLPGGGIDYGFLSGLAQDTGISSGRLGKLICDRFYLDSMNNGVFDNATLSLIDLSYIDELLAANEKVGCELFASVCQNPGGLGTLSRAARQAENYGGNNEWEGYKNMVDLGDLIHKTEQLGLVSRYTSELYDALERCVVYQVTGKLRADAHGLSCYYSYNGNRGELAEFAKLKGNDPYRWLYHYQQNHEMPAEGMAYMQSLEAHFGLAVAEVRPLEALAESFEGAPVEIVIENGQEVAVLELTASEAQRLASVSVELIRLGVDGASMVVLGTEQLVYEDYSDSISYRSFNGTWLALDRVFIYLQLTDYTSHDDCYSVPVLLNGERNSLLVSYLHESGKYQILGARLAVDENGVGSKDLHALAVSDVIEPLYLFEDVDGVREWVVAGSVTYSNETSIAAQKLPEGMYFLSFTMTDVVGNTYTSSAVKTVVDR